MIQKRPEKPREAHLISSYRGVYQCICRRTDCPLLISMGKLPSGEFNDWRIYDAPDERITTSVAAFPSYRVPLEPASIDVGPKGPLSSDPFSFETAGDILWCNTDKSVSYHIIYRNFVRVHHFLKRLPRKARRQLFYRRKRPSVKEEKGSINESLYVQRTYKSYVQWNSLHQGCKFSLAKPFVGIEMYPQEIRTLMLLIHYSPHLLVNKYTKKYRNVTSDDVECYVPAGSLPVWDIGKSRKKSISRKVAKRRSRLRLWRFKWTMKRKRARPERLGLPSMTRPPISMRRPGGFL